MSRRFRALSALLVGLGAGAVGGAYLGPAVLWSAVFVAAVGIALSFVGSSERPPGSQPANRSAGDRTTPANLGTRVEQILRVAEEQAEDHRDRARREAERILDEARSEARTIVDGARAQVPPVGGPS